MSPEIDLFKDSYILVQIVCGFLSLHTPFASREISVCMYVSKCVCKQQNRKETKHEMYIWISIGLFTVELVNSMILSTMFHILCRGFSFTLYILNPELTF